ncbi:MAG: hypothetical protein ACK55Z_19395, partial [bacterium]
MLFRADTACCSRSGQVRFVVLLSSASFRFKLWIVRSTTPRAFMSPTGFSLCARPLSSRRSATGPRNSLPLSEAMTRIFFLAGSEAM